MSPVQHTLGTPLALIGLCVALAAVLPFNVPLFRLLNGLHSPFTDPIWLALTSGGDGLLLGIVLGAFLVFNPRITALGLLLLILSALVVHAIKIALPMARPAEFLPGIHIIGPTLRSGSFPSGHAASALAAGLAVAHYARSWLMVISVLALSILVAISRVFVGAHFPLDVIAGLLVTLTLYYCLLSFVWPRWEPRIPANPRFGHRLFLVFLVLEIAVCVCTILFYGPRFADYPPLASLVGFGVLCVLYGGWVKHRRRSAPA